MGISVPEFEKQFKKLFGPLCLFAMRMVDSVEDSEDIVQQSFVDVWEKLSDQQSITHLKAYMYRVVRNRCLNHLAQQKSVVLLDNDLESLEIPVDDGDILRAERENKLWQAIEKLPPERKKVFLYAKRDGMKYMEIAEELGISIKTVENQMSKALKSLKENAIKLYLFIFS